ncbi:MAG: hypothetical protein ABSF65_06775 [Candidatus Bathyarchaeia archaeon]|jgi:hypothetical protein
MHQSQIAKELCPNDETCVLDHFVCDGEQYPWIYIFRNTVTGAAVVARHLGKCWYRKLAEGESLEEAKLRWKARNDPPSLF